MPTSCLAAPSAHTISVPAGVRETILSAFSTVTSSPAISVTLTPAAGADPDGEIGESHDPETHIIPLVLDAASGARSDIKVFGTDYPTPDGSCVRDYIHVTDLADAHVRALEYLSRGGENVFLNLGNERGTSVLEIIDSVKRVTGRDFTVTPVQRRAGDPAVLVGSRAKAKSVLGWEPKYADIDVIVSTAWNWYCKKEY